MNLRVCVLFCGLLPGFAVLPAQAQSDECTEIGTVVSAQGSVRIQATNSENWRRAERQSKVCEGDRVQTGSRSRAAIKLNNESLIRVRQQSEARLENFADESATASLMRLVTGVIQFFSRKPQEYSIRTTTATIGIRGTEFVVSVTDDATRVTVYEGEVQAENDVAPVTLRGGETVNIEDGRSLRAERIVDGRDQVQWGLYYPPVLALGSVSDGDLEESLACANRGDFDCAFEAADDVPPNGRDAAWRVHLAALLLAVGDVEAAGSSLTEALFEDPNSAAALALEAIVGLVQGRTEAARSSARAAVAAGPDSAAARIALSYVLQAELNIEDARAQLLLAVESEPENALARARLAELELALGNHGAARTEAARATELDPDLSRGHMVAGYAALAEIDVSAATDAFERALELDDADPMAHLGLALTLIRRGDLVAGRIEIETAVALDSNSAILRPYLGRAYYEEKRSPLDAEQYAMARQLDPEDPTAYLFDALRLHSENRPVEARVELEASIERNDNRAVYRGRNLLDQDRAARGASLAKIFDTLGFGQQGINEATGSLTTDPANASAHRFLSDSYRQVRRREIARVSELLQAQMLQDINNNPVQPSVSAANLNLGVGAGDVGLNEFTGLFESNGLQPALSLLSGSNDTNGLEGVVTGTYDNLSISLGAFDYESDGWRENNAQDQELGNLFVQWAVSPVLNLQAEISSRETSEGDLAFNFDPEDFDPNFTVDKELDSERIGLRYSPTPDIDLLISRINTERTEEQSFVDIVIPFLPSPPFPPGIPDFASAAPGPYTAVLDEDGSQNEIQYLHSFDFGNLTIGYSEAEVDGDLLTTTVPTPSLAEEADSFEIEQTRSYAYFTARPLEGLAITLGASDDEYERLPIDISETSSKFGAIWQFTRRQTLRIAAFEATKPALVNNRSLEPTQIAGFNQIFDDANGTRTENLGIGYDFRISDNMAFGFEVTDRDMAEPTIFTDINTFETVAELEDREEEIDRIYFNWTPTRTLSMSAQAIYDRYKASDELGIDSSTFAAGIPERVKTVSIPVAVNYFSPQGWYTGITLTRVDQEVLRDTDPVVSGIPSASGDDQFNVLDLRIGYRLPKRMGSVGLEIRNATDEEFMYQDDSYREFRDEPSTGPYFPERTAFVRANFVF